MSGPASTFYTARFLLPDYLIRERANELSCPVWRDGALVVPTAGTCTVKDPTGADVSTGSIVVAGSIATHDVLSSELPDSIALGSGWLVEWALTLTGETEPILFKNKAHLVRSDLHPVVALADLYRRQSSLDPDGTNPIHSKTNTEMQGFLDEAWVTLLGKVTAKGPLPFLVMEPTALRESHLLLALHLIFDDFATRLNEVYSDHSMEYMVRFRTAFRELSFEYDSGQSGQRDSTKKRVVQGPVFLTHRRVDPWGR